MKRFYLLVYSLLVVVVVQAQSVDLCPKFDDVAATFVNHEGDEQQIETDESYDAPLTVTFAANPTDTTGFEIRYEWKIEQVKDEVSKLLVRRNEEVTTYTFTEGGDNVSYRATLAITYSLRGADDWFDVEAEPITFTLVGSSLQLYNAFSPNGDGTNDVYRVKTKSLLSFRMKIFNRWGQEIVSGNQNTLPTEYENDFTYYVCWDGTYHGSRVEDGVYFILVEAEGSDGIKYVKRGDINILTRSTKGERHE